MKKSDVSLFVFLTTILALAQFTSADYTLSNASTTDPTYATYSVWRPAGRDASGDWWPAGWRTQGWYKIEPSATRILSVPADNPVVYIRVIDHSGERKPSDHATRDASLFWIHSSEAFTAVETNEGNFLKSDHGSWSLERAHLYKYQNGGSHAIADTPQLPDRPAQQIYKEAIHSVVWIRTNLGNESVGTGSGVLIDKRRRLVVTNEHVRENARSISVFFPWESAAGVNKQEDFYLENQDRLETRGYVTRGQVIAQNVRNDLAIVQLDQIPTTAREIKHEFSRNVEDSMEKGDKVHIFGNPGNRLWNLTQGTFLMPHQVCSIEDGELVGCLEMEGDIHGGNSGGPVLNGQGMLIGILTAGTDETVALAAPAKNVKALLDTVPAILPPIPPQRTYPKRVFKIRNRTGVIDLYQADPHGNGNTCCLAPDLRNETSALSERIDLIFLCHPQGEVSAITHTVGDKAEDRLPNRNLWPSDHAGVVAEITFQ